MADDAPAFVDLHAAARAGDLVALGARVAAGDEVDGRDKHKRTALHMAAWAGQVARRRIRALSLLFVVARRRSRASRSRAPPVPNDRERPDPPAFSRRTP